MKLNGNILVLALIFALLGATVTCRPAWVSDENAFLADFIGYAYLNVLGVILAITLASLAQAHLTLNRLEESRGKTFLESTRHEIKDAAYWLIGLFAVGFLLVLVKPLPEPSELWLAVVNAGAIFILAFYILILLDITIAVFDIKADIPDSKDGKDQG